MDDTEFDRFVLDDFINKSLEFYGYHDYNFGYIATMKSISSHTLSNDGFILDRIADRSKEFNIGDKKGILGYNETSIYLQMDKDSITESLLSLGIPIMDVSEKTSSSIRETLAWILLSSKGYYVHNQKFNNTSLDHDNAIPNSDFEGKQQITPDNFAQCFKQS